MTSIAPDIPELEDVPETARSIVYMRALGCAVRSPSTLLAGLTAFVLAAGIGATQGGALYGMAGAIAGAALGAVASAYFFFKVLLPWRARRLVPLVLQQVDSKVLDEARRADERVGRMIAAYKQREAGIDDEKGDGHPRRRLP